jgi:hypothetical protein
MNNSMISKKKQYAAMAALLVAVLGSGCAKTRDAKFPEGAGENIFETTLFSKSDVSVETAAEQKLLDSGSLRKLRPAQLSSRVQIREARAPEALRSMFKSLEIVAAGEKSYPIKFKVDRQFVTAFRVVDDANELSVQEQELLQKGAKGESLMPLFQYRVQGYGRVVRSKNDLGEETTTLRMKPTEWKDATHVQVSTLPEDRIPVAPASREQADRIFVREQIEGQIFSKSELESELSIRVAREGQFRAVIDGSELLLEELVSLGDSSVTPAQRDLIAAQDRGSPASSGISRCSAREAQAVSVKDCVKISRYRVPLTHVEARRRILDAEGTLGAEVEFRPISKKSSRLVQITKDPLVAEVGATSLDPRRSIKVADAAKWEFLFRRTMEDSPNSFDYTFAGSAGPLEIVRMVFEKEKVRLVRADAMLPVKGGNRVDLSDLMSLPVSYVREEKHDAQGNLLAVPRVVPADHTHPEAVAYVSWEGNSVPPVSSPLNYYELGQCFAGMTDLTVSGVDNRMATDGIISLSLNATYMNNPGVDCAGVLRAGYFDQVQASFTFQERISIKKYALAGSRKAEDEKPLLDVPYEAQKKLGFGLFTYSKNTPNKHGNVGTEGTVTPLPALFDIRGGKRIRYVLSGIPTADQDREARAQIIQATREVVADWNRAFRNALKGTPMERSDDVLELLVEGDDQLPNAALGDLDVNHIYYVQKRTSSGVIGLGGSHHNPRSGKVEAASVFMYGGNIDSYVESMKELRKAREQFLKELSSPLVTGPAAIDTKAAPGISAPKEGAAAPSSRRSGGSDLASAQMRRVGKALARRAGVSIQERLDSIATMPRKPVELAFYEAFAQGVKEGALSDSRRMQHLVDQKLIEVLAGRIPGREMAKLKLDSKRSEVLSKFFDNLEKAHICAYEAPEFSLDIVDSEKSDLELAIGVYKPTLAHELGHNLGLRHNFIGSFDKKNWKFNPSEKSTRDYSSVMDYLANDEHYDGLGPQDIAAIRTAYAGVVETNSGEMISLSEALKRSGAASWHQLTTSAVEAAGVRAMPFCSDEDAGMTPVCNRFDRGTTPAEIVQASVDDYRQLYTLRNFAGNKLGFSVLGTGGYVGRTFARFLPVRQFLEETIYQAIQGSPEVNAYAEAAFGGLDFFHSVIRTPDAPTLASENERVLAVRLQDGRTVKVERKWLKDIRFDQDSDRLRIRGVEFDKVVALMMLTERQLGFPRYEAVDLRFSYPELEKMVFAQQVKSPLELPTIGLLHEVLSNRLQPVGAVIDDSGRTSAMIPLDTRFQSDVTEMMRYYAMLGGILFQDVDGLEAKDNGSLLFRVLSSFSPRAGAVAVVRPGASSTDGDQLKYWAPEGAVVSGSLVERVELLGRIRSMREQIVSGYGLVMGKLAELQAAVSSGASPEKIEELKGQFALVLSKVNEGLGALPESAGIRKVEELAGVVEQVMSAAQALEQAKKSYDPRKLALAVDQRRTQISGLLKQNPVLGELLQAMAGAEGMPEMLGAIVGGVSTAADQGVVFSNLEMLNRFLLMAHPELRR